VLDEQFWTNRYRNNQTGWDIGYVSTPIKTYIDQLVEKNISILIPGCGNGYEAEYLWKKGFKNTVVSDISPVPLKNLKNRVPDFPKNQLMLGDFFDLKNKFDLILEQTFFSSFPPGFRVKYVNKCFDLLPSGGKLVGVLFNIPLYDDHPPYGGSKEAYLPLFNKFHINVFEPCTNSIPPRNGEELFINLQKP